MVSDREHTYNIDNNNFFVGDQQVSMWFGQGAQGELCQQHFHGILTWLIHSQLHSAGLFPTIIQLPSPSSKIHERMSSKTKIGLLSSKMCHRSARNEHSQLHRSTCGSMPVLNRHNRLLQLRCDRSRRKSHQQKLSSQ